MAIYDHSSTLSYKVVNRLKISKNLKITPDSQDNFASALSLFWHLQVFPPSLPFLCLWCLAWTHLWVIIVTMWLWRKSTWWRPLFYCLASMISSVCWKNSWSSNISKGWMHSVENLELQIIFEINSLTTLKIVKFKFWLFRNGDEIHRPIKIIFSLKNTLLQYLVTLINI